MPTKFRLPGARLARSCVLVVCLAGAGALLAGFLLGAGRFLYAEALLQPSDAILVFAGTLAERPLEAPRSVPEICTVTAIRWMA